MFSVCTVPRWLQSAFVFFLVVLKSDGSRSDAQKVKVTLQTGLPIAGAVGATAGGGFGTSWITEGIAGVFRSGCQPDQCFTTLYSLYSICKRTHKNRDLVPPDPATLGMDWCVCVTLAFYDPAHTFFDQAGWKRRYLGRSWTRMAKKSKTL